MKRTNLLALGAFTVVAALAVVSQADALQSARAYKIVDLTFLVTPSPVPVVFRHAAPAAAPAPAAPARAIAAVPSSAQLARFIEDSTHGPVQLASAGTPGGLGWDVPPGSGMMIAQTSVQPSPVPVQFVAKADPNAAYLRVIPHFPAPDGIFHAGYGTTVFPCAFEIFTYYTTINKLVDWGYGTVISGGNPTFPIENYPTASYLSWAVPDFSPTFKTYANSGSPGEQAWSGLAGQSQQHCIDLSILVPVLQPPGTFTATIQYTLNVN